ncbi:hypothetical protein AB0M54_24365 [Actinoplanes sp. NPDC051470]|uniref:hypothetical protein n=1 Tax=Actinoplanes sp. NPDC051470 TaxID=3157224 RepID=UPI00342C0BB6
MPLAAPVLIGHQRPRHLIVPECHSNAACETIDLYHQLGQKLDPWQELGLHSGLGEDSLGEWVALLIAILLQRQNGKGNVAEARGIGGLFLMGDTKIIHSAHRQDTAMNAFRRAKMLVDGNYDLSRRVKRMPESNGEALIELMDGRVWEFRTRGRDGGRGLSAQTLFLDEALEMELEVMADLLPTLLAVPGAQVWLFSTPPKMWGQYLTQLRKRVLASEERDVAYLEWSNPKGADLSDPAVLAAANPALGIRLTLRMLELLRRQLGDDLFARECGGIWPEEEDAGKWLAIPKTAWSGAEVDEKSQIVGRPALGVYVPPDRSYGAIAAAGSREFGGRQVELTSNEDVVDFRPGTRWIVSRLKQLEKHNPSVVVVDDKATAEEAEAAGLVVHRASVGDVVTGCGLLFDGVAGPVADARDVHHIGQKELTDAAAGATQRKVGQSWAWMADAPLPAASLALFGHSTPRIHRPDKDDEMWGFFA